MPVAEPARLVASSAAVTAETDELSMLRAALGSLRIEREVARGATATVYLAEDTIRQCRVALKVLRPELAGNVGSERFRREISLAPRLQHPNILVALDSGEIGSGQLWLTMPYVEGETLRERVRRERRMPIDAALTITLGLADALDHAHDIGIVHRDIKPENILIADGRALLVDFGIARPLSSTGDPRLTDTGYTVGTPSYMSPEQSAGLRIDSRSDVYSLAVVLYEMLAGEQAFPGFTGLAVALAPDLSITPRVRARRPDVPKSIDVAIAKAMAIEPSDRHDSAGAFARALTEPVPPARNVFGDMVGGLLRLVRTLRGGA